MLGSDIAAALPALQAEAESLLVDRCTLARKSGTTTDPTSLLVTDIWTAYRTAVPCRLKPGNTQPAQTSAGGQDITAVGATLSVAVSVVDVLVDDRATLTQSGDASLVGVHLYVRAVPRGSQLTLRRLPVSEVQG